MKIEKLGKIYIGVGIGIFIAMMILNIIVYLHFVNITDNLRIIEKSILSEDPQIIRDLLIAIVLFAAILIATDIIVLIQITKLILDGTSMLAKD